VKYSYCCDDILPMKYFIPVIYLLLTSACQQPAPPAQQESPAKVEKDSSTRVRSVYVTRAMAAMPDYQFSLGRMYYLPKGPLKWDSSAYAKETWICIRNKHTHLADSVLLTDLTSVNSNLQIKDVSAAMHFEPTLIELSWQGDSDMFFAAYLSYDNGKLRQLFTTNGPVQSLQWQDSITLKGTVYMLPDDAFSMDYYAFIVNTNDQELHIIKPDTELLKMEATARIDIPAFKMVNGKSVPYVIKESTSIMLDTFYRKSELVRMTVEDSIVVYGNSSEVRSGLQFFDAG